MNKTYENMKDTVNNADQHSLGDQSPRIKYQNDATISVNQSKQDF